MPSCLQKCKVAEKFVDATLCMKRRGWTFVDDARDAQLVWDNAFNVDFDALGAKTAVNHFIRTSEVGHKVRCRRGGWGGRVAREVRARGSR